MRLHQRDEGLARRRRHEGCFRSNAFHGLRASLLCHAARPSSLKALPEALAESACRARSIRCGGVA